MPLRCSRSVDPFGRLLPSWVRNECSMPSERRECLTRSQRYQLGIPAAHLDPLFGSSVMSRPHARTAAEAACLAHTRRYHFVCQQTGDVPIEVSVHSPFLSCRGTPLTADTSSLARLQSVASTKEYEIPFWLSAADARNFAALTPARRLVGSGGDLSKIFTRLAQSRECVEVLNDRSEISHVVNLSELLRPDMSPPWNLILSLFRSFTPLNVLSGKPFEPLIEDRIRMESIMSRRWCSVWGSPEDFQKRGLSLLSGALGLQLLDSLGNELFISNAFCTRDPLSAYSAAYPADFICFTT